MFDVTLGVLIETYLRTPPSPEFPSNTYNKEQLMYFHEIHGELSKLQEVATRRENIPCSNVALVNFKGKHCGNEYLLC